MPLIGDRPGPTTAMTWIPEALRRGSAAGHAEALASLARELEVDIAWVSAGQAWASRAARLLSTMGARPAWACTGVLGRVAASMGWQEVIRLSAGAPGRLAGPIDRALHGLLVELRMGEAAGCGIAVVADDLASPAGWLVSPDFALRALLPAYRVAVDEWQGEAVFHSDGDVRQLMPDLRRAGFDAVHLASLAPQEIEASCDAAWSAGLEALGGIPAVELSSTVAAETLGRAAGDLAGRGPLVVADDGGIASADQVVMLRAALDSARRREASDER